MSRYTLRFDPALGRQASRRVRIGRRRYKILLERLEQDLPKILPDHKAWYALWLISETFSFSLGKPASWWQQPPRTRRLVAQAINDASLIAFHKNMLLNSNPNPNPNS